MISNPKSIVLTEDLVYRVVGDSEKRIEGRLDDIDQKLDSKFDRVMTQLDSIAGQFRRFDDELNYAI